MSVWFCVCLRVVRASGCVYVCKGVCARVRMLVCVCVCAHEYAQLCVCVYVRERVLVCVRL